MVRVKKTDNSKSVFEGSIDVDSFLLVVEELPSGRIFSFIGGTISASSSEAASV